MKAKAKPGHLQSLTPKQVRFAQAIVSGKNPGQAYREAYATKAPFRSRALEVEASRTARKPHIAAYIAQLQAKLERKAILSRQRSLEILTVIAEEEKQPQPRIAAITQASRMQGYDAPARVEMKVEGSLLWQIRNR